MKKSLCFLVFLFICSVVVVGIKPQKAAYAEDTLTINTSFYKFKAKQLFIPSSLILCGTIGLMTNTENWFDNKLHQKVVDDWNTPFKSYAIDNYLLAIPVLFVYGLNMVGVKGKHQFVDRSVIVGISTIATIGFVSLLKPLTSNLRPDGTTYDSWPSGHTALAFAGAEFMRTEFKERSAWYGVAAYGVATSVGAFRIYNNRHWFTDVVAGAGVGILSARMAYWLFPSVTRIYSGSHKHKSNSFANVSILPSYNAGTTGFYLTATF